MRISLILVSLLFAHSLMAESPDRLKVMSYNLRYASLTGANAWPARRPLVRELIEKHEPDLIGTQEGLYFQLRQMEEDLPRYRWMGLGREGGSRGEFMAVFYLADRLDPIEYDHYWLSDTPSVIGSASWGNKVRRMVTWVKFRDRRNKRDFYFVNTHFDHESEPARQKSAELLAERLKGFSPAVPVIVTGDFNAAAETSVSYKTLTQQGGLADAWTGADHRTARTRSFNGFVYPAPEAGERIDWILLRGPIRAVDIMIDDWSKGNQYPSDHFPVVATLEVAP